MGQLLRTLTPLHHLRLLPPSPTHLKASALATMPLPPLWLQSSGPCPAGSHSVSAPCCKLSCAALRVRKQAPALPLSPLPRPHLQAASLLPPASTTRTGCCVKKVRRVPRAPSRTCRQPRIASMSSRRCACRFRADLRVAMAGPRQRRRPPLALHPLLRRDLRRRLAAGNWPGGRLCRSPPRSGGPRRGQRHGGEGRGRGRGGRAERRGGRRRGRGLRALLRPALLHRGAVHVARTEPSPKRGASRTWPSPTQTRGAACGVPSRLRNFSLFEP